MVKINESFINKRIIRNRREYVLKHLLLPPNFKKAIWFLSLTFATLGAIKTWTSWLSKITALVFTLYAILCVLIYLYCVLSNTFRWIINLKAYVQQIESQNEDLKFKNKQLIKNNKGLIEQYNADLAEKNDILYNLRRCQAMLDVANKYIDENKIEKYEAHITATKEIFENGYQNSKNNK